MEYCIKGIELHRNEANPHTIYRGLNQLAYACVQLSKQCISNQINTWHDEELEIEFICPILVTTAPLYVFKKDLTLDSINNAKEIDNIAKEVNFLIVSQKKSLMLKSYIDEAYYELQESNPNLDERLKTFDKILNESDFKEYHTPNIFFLKDILSHPSERILVVNYKYFDDMIKIILKLINRVQSTLKRYAILELNKETLKTSIKSI